MQDFVNSSAQGTVSDLNSVQNALKALPDAELTALLKMDKHAFNLLLKQGQALPANQVSISQGQLHFTIESEGVARRISLPVTGELAKQQFGPVSQALITLDKTTGALSVVMPKLPSLPVITTEQLTTLLALLSGKNHLDKPMGASLTAPTMLHVPTLKSHLHLSEPVNAKAQQALQLTLKPEQNALKAIVHDTLSKLPVAEQKVAKPALVQLLKAWQMPIQLTPSANGPSQLGPLLKHPLTKLSAPLSQLTKLPSNVSADLPKWQAHTSSPQQVHVELGQHVKLRMPQLQVQSKLAPAQLTQLTHIINTMKALAPLLSEPGGAHALKEALAQTLSPTSNTSASPLSALGQKMKGLLQDIKTALSQYAAITSKDALPTGKGQVSAPQTSIPTSNKGTDSNATKAPIKLSTQQGVVNTLSEKGGGAPNQAAIKNAPAATLLNPQNTKEVPANPSPIDGTKRPIATGELAQNLKTAPLKHDTQASTLSSTIKTSGEAIQATASSLKAQMPVKVHASFNQLEQLIKAEPKLQHLVNAAFSRMIDAEHSEPRRVASEIQALLQPNTKTPQAHGVPQQVQQLALVLSALQAPSATVLSDSAPLPLQSKLDNSALDTLLKTLLPQTKLTATQAKSVAPTLNQAVMNELAKISQSVQQTQQSLAQQAASSSNASVNQPEASPQHIHFSLPMRLPDEVLETQISIGHYERKTSKAEAGESVWYVRLTFDYAELGQLQAHAELVESKLTCQLTATSETLKAQAAQHVASLQKRLLDKGLTLAEISLHQGSLNKHAQFDKHAIVNVRV